MCCATARLLAGLFARTELGCYKQQRTKSNHNTVAKHFNASAGEKVYSHKWEKNLCQQAKNFWKQQRGDCTVGSYMMDVCVCVCMPRLWRETGAAEFDKSCNPCPQSCHRSSFHLTCPFPCESFCLMSPRFTPTYPSSHPFPFLTSPFSSSSCPLCVPPMWCCTHPPPHLHHHQ